MSTPGSDARRGHERRMVEDLRRAGALSRAALAQRTRLSPPAVGQVVEGLLAAGLLEEGGAQPTAGGMGRPSRPLRLERATPRFVVIQLSVKRTHLAALPVAGPIDERWPVRFDTPKRATTWQRRVKQAAKRIRLKQPWAVVMSVPGIVDEPGGRVLLSPNLPWIEKTDLIEQVRTIWDAPVLLVQTVRALALGHVTAEPEPRDFLLVDFGTAVSAALVRDGRLYDGALPLTGQLAHTRVPGNGRPCPCGDIGCAETLVSRAGLLQSFGRNKTWKQLIRHVEKRGVPAWMSGALDAIAVNIALALNITGVGHTVLTGSLSELPGTVIGHLSRTIERSAMWSRFGKLSVNTAPRRCAAGLATATVDRLLLPSVRIV